MPICSSQPSNTKQQRWRCHAKLEVPVRTRRSKSGINSCTMRLCIPRTLRGYRSSSTSSLGQTYLKRRATCYKAWLGDGSRHDFRWESNTHPSEPQLRTELTTLTSSTFLKHNSKIQITERRHS